VAAPLVAAAVVINDEFISKHSIFGGSVKTVYKLPYHRTIENNSNNPAELEEFIVNETLSRLPGMHAIKFLSVLILQFEGDDFERRRVAALLDVSCVIYGMATATGSTTCTVAMFRQRGRSLNLGAITLSGLWALEQKHGRTNFTDVKVKLFAAFLRIGTDVRCNFDIAELLEHDADTVCAAWDSKALGEIDWEITKVKGKPAKKRSAREAVIASIGDRYLSRRRNSLDGSNPVMCKADSPDLLPLSSFVGAGAILLRTFDPNTGALIVHPLSDWIEKALCLKYTLVLGGQSDLGKTALASALVAYLATHDQCNEHPYYLKVGTVDILREAIKDNLMVEQVPVVLDEVTPGMPRGTRPCMTLDDVKRLTEVEGTTVTDGRCNDIAFKSEQARVFTTNSLTPHGWHPGLPQDVWVMSDATRALLPPNVKAVFKRCLFGLVEQNLIPVSVRTAHAERKRADKSARYAGAFAG